MIKNYDAVKEIEIAWLKENALTPKEALDRMNDMYDFAIKHSHRKNIPPENSQHIQSLIKMSKSFSQYGTAPK